MNESMVTVGILYPGEMGAALAQLLRSRGVRTATTLKHRSQRTIRLAEAAGVVALDSLPELIRQSEVVISVVPPAAAEEVADSYCQYASLSPPSAVYVDANAISPELAEHLAEKLAGSGRSFVDASVNGLARTLTASGTLFLSGGDADAVARLFDGGMRVKVLGREPGTASAMKMLLSGLSKGVCSLFVELALLAERRGMLQEMIEIAAEIYPGITTVAQRMIPTIPQHRVRRAEEMCELERTTQAAGQGACLIAAIRQFHEEVARLPMDQCPDPAGWTVALLIKRLVEEGVLAGALSATQRTVTSASA